jgi:hypothetical protein
MIKVKIKKNKKVQESFMDLVRNAIDMVPPSDWVWLAWDLFKYIIASKRLGLDGKKPEIKISKNEYIRRAVIFFKNNKKDIEPLVQEISKKYPEWKSDADIKKMFYEELRQRIKEKFKDDEDFRYDFLKSTDAFNDPADYVVNANYSGIRALSKDIKKTPVKRTLKKAS